MKYIYIYKYPSLPRKKRILHGRKVVKWGFKKKKKKLRRKKRIQSLFIFIFISIQYNKKKKKQLSFSFDAIFYRNRSDTIPFRLNKTDRQVLGKGLGEEEEKGKKEKTAEVKEAKGRGGVRMSPSNMRSRLLALAWSCSSHATLARRREGWRCGFEALDSCFRLLFLFLFLFSFSFGSSLDFGLSISRSLRTIALHVDKRL